MSFDYNDFLFERVAQPAFNAAPDGWCRIEPDLPQTWTHPISQLEVEPSRVGRNLTHELRVAMVQAIGRTPRPQWLLDTTEAQIKNQVLGRAM